MLLMIRCTLLELVSAGMMDQRNMDHREGYDKVMNEVSALIPWFHWLP